MVRAYYDYPKFGPLRVQVQLSAAEPEELEAHLREQTELLASAVRAKTKYYMVIDARAGMQAPPRVRKLQAEWLEQNSENLKMTCLGISFVVREAVVRGVITAIFWLTKSPVPYRVHSNLKDALELGIATCDNCDIPLPDLVRKEPEALVESALPPEHRIPRA